MPRAYASNHSKCQPMKIKKKQKKTSNAKKQTALIARAIHVAKENAISKLNDKGAAKKAPTQC